MNARAIYNEIVQLGLEEIESAYNGVGAIVSGIVVWLISLVKGS